MLGIHPGGCEARRYAVPGISLTTDRCTTVLTPSTATQLRNTLDPVGDKAPRSTTLFNASPFETSDRPKLRPIVRLAKDGAFPSSRQPQRIHPKNPGTATGKAYKRYRRVLVRDYRPSIPNGYIPGGRANKKEWERRIAGNEAEKRKKPYTYRASACEPKRLGQRRHWSPAETSIWRS